eukprot:CAMPEP_0176026864 /NCGR_PEP_ID=MMETSP0120_2-20121206/13167_1 /TAXON_ID=160619 /ORGANISM="Kryptoperidinium foliaceum, Strain CCMP 1326" /LENGTH=522 /DNA_ID=CAMNT_0017360067 /DNA_START=50 /DNA_END=1618 /DNA_ORIENTATION=-
MDPTMSKRRSYMRVVEETPQTNPFANRTATLSQGCCRWVFMRGLGLLLFPIRVGLSLLNVIVVLVLTRLATLGLPDGDMDPLTGTPLASWRRALVAPLGILARYQLLLLGFWRIRVKGSCAAKSEAPIIVANHVSGFVEGTYFVMYGKVAERSFVSNPVLGPVMKATSSICVDRSDPSSREIAKKALLRRSSDLGFPQTVVFPEGACTNGTAVVQFKVGAFAPGVPVQPVCFRYPNHFFDASFTFPTTPGSYLLGLLLQPATAMEVEYLPVYRPSGAELAMPALYAANVQQAIATALGVPTTKHAAEDVALCCASEKLRMPAEAGIVVWQALSEGLTGLRVKEAMVVLENFRTLDKEGNGCIDFDTFADSIRRPPQEETDNSEEKLALASHELRGIFDLLDMNGDGYVSFQEYLWGVAVLNGRGDEEKVASLKWMFDSLTCGQGYFTKERLAVLLDRTTPGLGSEARDRLCAEADLDGDGLVSREEFIAFATKHCEDLALTADRLLRGVPVSMERKVVAESA